MKKQLTLRLALITVLGLSLNSCRTGEDYLTSKEETYHSNKFQVFNSQDGNPINYADGFKFLLEKYDSLNKTQYGKTAFLKAGNFNKNTAEYVEFNIHSQDIVQENGDRWILYPRIKDAAVNGIMVAILSNEEETVEFRALNPESENYTRIIDLFRAQYLKSILNIQKNEASRGPGFPGQPPADIPPIVITIPNPGGGGGLSDPGGGDIPPKGCTKYQNCISEPSDSGPGADSDPQQNQDIVSQLQNYPCAQNLVQQLPTLKNDIATAMRQIFENNSNYNITFKPKTGLGNTDGITFSSSTNTGSFNAIININTDVLQHSTKEYILVTMYHEVIHAFLAAEKSRLGEATFHDQYPGVIVGYDYAPNGNIINRFTFVAGHQQLGPFLSTLQNILSTYNPNLSQATIKAMAKAGITTMTAEEITLNKNERDVTLENYKGTKCP